MDAYCPKELTTGGECIRQSVSESGRVASGEDTLTLPRTETDLLSIWCQFNYNAVSTL